MSGRTRAGAVALLLGALAGCGESREYAVPAEVCGVPVDPAVLAPFLPPGETVEQSAYASRPANPRCSITVDGQTVLTVKADVIEPAEDPMKVHERLLVDADRIPVGDDARVADATALAVAACTYEGKPRKFVAQLFPPSGTDDVAERREALTRLMTAYFPAVRREVGCSS
ncbi:hypothetical protein ACFVZW_12855 [Streptomyces sp. NPDC059567]|uniref:hypothetical protein n=1 Tax=Streptomyces sp. NPDC059567 TaxID=3346867 RepID=UPI0036A3C662